VQRVYDELRKVSIPDQEVRRRVDLCVEISKFVVSRASSRLDGRIPEGEEQDWPEVGSLFVSSTCKSGSLTSFTKGTSEHSSQSSVKRQEAAAEAAASQAVLKVLKEQEREQLEIQCLEAEIKRKIADQEAAAVRRRLEQEAEEVKRKIQREEEEAKIKTQIEEERVAIQKTLEEKRRKMQHLEAVKGLNAARARMLVYDQVRTTEEEEEGKHTLVHKIVADNQVPVPISNSSVCVSPVPKAVTTSSSESTAELVKVLTGALSANRIPIPEPSVFSGDPLKYNDWKLSFETLIDQKNIQDKEKIYYLRRYALLPREVVSGKENQPYAQRTDLGWCIVGHGNPCVDYGDSIGVSHHIIVKEVAAGVETSVNLKTKVHYVNRIKVKEITSADVIKVLESDFLERIIEDDSVSQEDLKFLSKLTETITQRDDGHYEMPLPFKEERPNLPNNKICAIHRLKCLERRLKKDQRYYKDYVTFMNNILSRGEAEKVPEEELDHSSVWYIPHHGVYHPQKPGKIRVVFDCSAKFLGTSLNDHLLPGPDLTNSLVGVLCRFRKSFVAVMCDIERMFHQFYVKGEDQDYLRFLWWENGDLETPPLVYRMKVHLFGAASSPGCANFGLKHLAAKGQGKFSEDTIHFIQRNFYVDDGIMSVQTEKEAIQLVKESRELCNTGKLRLHKFVSNNENVMATIPEEERSTVKDPDMTLSLPYMERALGVEWCITSDSFKFRVQVKPNPLTRRGVLATVASMYDPLGFMAPFVLLGKQILQQMCKEKVSWDDELPENLRPRWESWIRDLPNLAEMQVERCFLPSGFGKVRRQELHHFSDASVSGYGECTYLRTVNESDEAHCCLVMGKSRVSPTNVTTIPRLELSAAVVAVRVSDMLRKELEIKDLQEFFWTDSTVVLGYLNNDARRFQVFVANRIQRIKSSTNPEQWAYVSSDSNPADHASRGLTAEQLKTSSWFRGPKFLWEKDLPDRNLKVGEIKEDDPELRKTFVCNTEAKEVRSILDHLQKFSDWSRVVGAVARLKRKIKEYKEGKQRTNESTSLEERKEAEFAIIRLVQEEAFSDDMKRLKLKNMVAETKNSKLYKLSPFLDEEGILRVGGRLSQASLHPHVTHPAILPKNSHISALLVKHFHEKTQHQGRGMTVNEIRANGWWILGCSSAVSSHIFKCVKCRKFRRHAEEQRMGDLPQDRTETAPPFTYTGMDCFGPIHVKEGRKHLKKYDLLLTCLCARAIHIEMVDDLTTDAFINALRAFIAIRGNVRQLRCDQGTNFVGAKREFAELMKGMSKENVKALGCEFLLNPPAASHRGGVWERQIRTIRSVLTAILDKSAQRLDSTSLRTFLYEVMAIINSRPLTVENLNDPSGPEPLTPNHILTMKSTIILPPPGHFVREDLYLQRRWRRVRSI
ncbi:hypothetical protein NFI96_009207, partial [Prochilodus magdalenae]